MDDNKETINCLLLENSSCSLGWVKIISLSSIFVILVRTLK